MKNFFYLLLANSFIILLFYLSTSSEKRTVYDFSVDSNVSSIGQYVLSKEKIITTSVSLYKKCINKKIKNNLNASKIEWHGVGYQHTSQNLSYVFRLIMFLPETQYLKFQQIANECTNVFINPLIDLSLQSINDLNRKTSFYNKHITTDLKSDPFFQEYIKGVIAIIGSPLTNKYQITEHLERIKLLQLNKNLFVINNFSVNQRNSINEKIQLLISFLIVLNILFYLLMRIKFQKILKFILAFIK